MCCVAYRQKQGMHVSGRQLGGDRVSLLQDTSPQQHGAANYPQRQQQNPRESECWGISRETADRLFGFFMATALITLIVGFFTLITIKDVITIPVALFFFFVAFICSPDQACFGDHGAYAVDEYGKQHARGCCSWINIFPVKHYGQFAGKYTAQKSEYV